MSTIEIEFYQWVLSKQLLKFVVRDTTMPKRGQMDWKTYEGKNVLERWILDRYNMTQHEGIKDNIVFPLYNGITKLRDRDNLIYTELVTKKLAADEKRAREMMDYIYEMILEHNNSFDKNSKITIGHDDNYLWANGRKGQQPYEMRTKITYRLKFLLEHYKEDDVIKMVLRYKGALAGGQHWSPMRKCDENCIEVYPDEMFLIEQGEKYIRISPPDTEVECFASPVNSQLLPLGRPFCSLFKDVDGVFGSIGNFFDLDLSPYTVVAMSPPYTEHIMNEVAKKALKASEEAARLDKDLICSIVIPEWSDMSGYIDMKNSKYLIELRRHPVEHHINYDFWSDEAIRPARDTMQFLVGHVDEITFPDREYDMYMGNIIEGNPIHTVRIADEYGVYEEDCYYKGLTAENKTIMGLLKVVEVKKVKVPEDIPWWSTIDKEFKEEIIQHAKGKIDCITLIGVL